MEAAFIDIGTPKNGVLYRGDVAFDADEVEEKQPKIERLLKNGQSVIVQVTKNPIGAKGARLTQEVSLAGRFVVMVPGQPEHLRHLEAAARRRAQAAAPDPRGAATAGRGLIVRTAAEGATADELERDVRRLREQWEQISALAERSKPARLLYQEPPLVLRSSARSSPRSTAASSSTTARSTRRPALHRGRHPRARRARRVLRRGRGEGSRSSSASTSTSSSSRRSTARCGSRRVGRS